MTQAPVSPLIQYLVQKNILTQAEVPLAMQAALKIKLACPKCQAKVSIAGFGSDGKLVCPECQTAMGMPDFNELVRRLKNAMEVLKKEAPTQMPSAIFTPGEVKLGFGGTPPKGAPMPQPSGPFAPDMPIGASTPAAPAPLPPQTPVSSSAATPKTGTPLKTPMKGSSISPVKGSAISPAKGSRISPAKGSSLSPAKGSARPSSRRSNAAEGEAETAQGTRHKGRDMTVYLVVGIAGLLFVLAGVCFWLINKDAKKVVPHHPDPIPAIPVKSAAE